MSLLWLAANLYQQGEYDRAREALERSRAVLSSPESRGDFHLSMVKIQAGLLACRFREDGGAEAQLQEALEHFDDVTAYPFLREAHLALALWQWRRGREDLAKFHLESGLRVARDRGCQVNLFLNREDMTQICLLALELQVEPVWEYAAGLLTANLADLAEPGLNSLAQHPDRRIAEQAWNLLKVIHRARLPRLRIQTLGGFRVWRGDEPMKEGEWEGNLPRLLLQALIAHGTERVPRDLLLEAMGEEAAPAVTEGKFRLNLHRLRKVLEPGLDKNFGSSYIHAKGNLLCLDRELCAVDADEFLNLCRQGEQQEEAGNLKGALAAYRAAVELYRGDFLAEEPYLSWAESKRERLRRAHIDLLYRLAGLHERQGAFMRAADYLKKLIQMDACEEQAYQRLMLLHANRGRRTAALRLYADCLKALRDGLNTTPDAVTTAIYQKILETP